MTNIIGIGVTIALAVTVWLGNAQSNISTRVDALSVSQAATAQKAIDIDTRLSRIEDKLDKALYLRK